MIDVGPVYVIRAWQQWRIEYDGRLCDEADTLDEALRLGRVWARKLHRFLALQSEDGTITPITVDKRRGATHGAAPVN